MLERCRKRLEEAWYLYHCSKLSCEALRGNPVALDTGGIMRCVAAWFSNCIVRRKCTVLGYEQMDDNQVAAARQS